MKPESSFSYIKYALQNLSEVFSNLDIPIVGNTKQQLVSYLKDQKYAVIKKLMRNSTFVDKVKEKIVTNNISLVTF
jgi:hypothetical protein